MQAVPFAQANANFGPPPDLEESQCRTIPAFLGTVQRGSCEGAKLVVVAHMPTPEELARLNAGQPIFLTMLGGLSPHMLTTSFEEATNPA